MRMQMEMKVRERKVGMSDTYTAVIASVLEVLERR